MKRAKLDDQTMEEDDVQKEEQNEVQNQNNEEDQTVPNTFLINGDEVEKFGPLLLAVNSGDYENFSRHLCLEESKVAENVREYNKFLEYCSMFLHIAAKNGHVECIQILIDHGVNVNSEDEFNQSALHQAAKNGHLQCLKTLLRAGADCSVEIILPYYEINLDKINFNYISGSTPLHLAAQCNHVDCVEELIRYGADRNAVDANGATSLYIAVESGFNACALAHLSDLSNISDKRFLSLPTFSSSNTPLHLAIKNRMLDCIQKLVQLGSNVNHINKKGKSPLHTACLSERLPYFELKLKILKLLILEGHNADMNNAIHPFHTHRYEPELKEFLIAYGANVDFIVGDSCFSFFEFELKHNLKNPTLLKYIMNCIPRLPFLHSLNLYPISKTLPKYNTVWHSSVLPKNVTFRLVRGQKNMYVEMSSIKEVLEHERINFDTIFNQPSINKKFILLQQPFLNLLYDNINKVVEETYRRNISLKSYFRLSHRMDNFPHIIEYHQLRQHLWYQIMASNPRTLMHHCRFSIRKSMGPSNIKYVNKLPLPEKLQSYLLFENDEINWDL